MIEHLESRILLALVASLDKGVLSLGGTGAADTISVDISGDQLTATINRSMFISPVDEIRSIRIAGGAGNDRITLGLSVLIPATIAGGSGNDIIRGGPKPCQLAGEQGNDTLVAGPGRDTISGGGGVDTVSYAGRTDNLRISLDGKPNDGIKGEADNVLADIENATGGSGNDMIIGSARGDTLIGGAGDDTLSGGGGNDLLSGGRGNDHLSGGPGNDILLGVDSDSTDTLDGGEGYDSVAYDLIVGVSDTCIDTENDVLVLEV